MYKAIAAALLSVVALSACRQIDDLSHTQPFDITIGKSFVLQKDCRVIYSPFDGAGGKIIKKYYIKCDDFQPNEKSVGTLSKGQVIKIIKVDQETDPDFRWPPDFHVELVGKVGEQKSKFNGVGGIYSDMETVNISNNELDGSNYKNHVDHKGSYSGFFGDPPIFSSEYAKPLGADGLWWK